MSNDVIRCQVRCAGGEGEWIVSRLRVTEALGEPYELVVDVVSLEPAEPVLLLGADAHLTLEHDGWERAWSGIVRRVEKGDQAVAEGDLARRTHARLFVVPALRALEQTSDRRIFQELSAKDIIERVLTEALAPYGRTVDASQLTGSYPEREYCVQYAESHLAFVSRLMEEEGITYRFEHEEREVLVLVDDNRAFEDVGYPGGDTIPVDAQPRAGDAAIRELVQRQAWTANTVTTRDYDFTHASTPVEGQAGDGGEPRREVYIHTNSNIGGFQPGAGYSDYDAARRATFEHERQLVDRGRVTGAGCLVGFAAGAKFSIDPVGGSDLETELVITRLRQTFERAHDGGGALRSEFEAIPMAIRYRPARRHRRPDVASIESATVVGPAGEEIHTDELGRIKVQLAWDRQGQHDERSSCWMRVVQPWAGDGWGFVWLPRIGMEVVVQYVDGNPDRPVIIGGVYDGDHPPPYALPDGKTRSTIKSQSTPGGGGDNELRYDDLAGSEEIFLHAQKDLNEVVLDNHSTKVGANQTNDVGVDQTETIGADQSLDVGANRTVHVGGAFDETIDGSETRTVSAGVTETISGGETRTVTGGLTETIDGGETRAITGALSETVSAAFGRTIGAASTETIGGTLTQTIAGGATIVTPGRYDITAGGAVTITAPAGSLWVAVAGHKTIAPGGQTRIDSQWIKIGSLEKEAFTSKDAAVGLVPTFCVLQCRSMGVKLDTYGAAGGAQINKDVNSPIDLRKGGASLINAGLNKIANKAPAVLAGG